MRIVEFVNETKSRVVEQLSGVSQGGHIERRTVSFEKGTADMVLIRGGAIEKAAVTHLQFNQIKPPWVEEPSDYMVFQVEIFPQNPFCAMGHFNTEWSMAGPGPYNMNLDVFPAVTVPEDMAFLRQAMDGVAQQHDRDPHEMRKGLDEHYNMQHWDTPLAGMAGCKLLDLKDDGLGLFIDCYKVFFDAYMETVHKRSNAPYGEQDMVMKQRRNGKWLEYIALKDVAVKVGLSVGLSPDVLVKLSFPPSAVFE